MNFQLIKNPVEYLRKNFAVRASSMMYFFAGYLLIDEYLSQGYLFNPEDLFIIGSHESIITTLIIISTINLLRVRINERRNGKRESEEEV